MPSNPPADSTRSSFGLKAMQGLSRATPPLEPESTDSIRDGVCLSTIASSVAGSTAPSGPSLDESQIVHFDENSQPRVAKLRVSRPRESRPSLTGRSSMLRSMLQQGQSFWGATGQRDSMKHRRGSRTPRLGKMAEEHHARSSAAHKKTKLSYDSHSWWATTKLLLLGTGGGCFVLLPWISITLLSIAAVVVQEYFPQVDMHVPGEVPLSVGSTMGLLLAFRLNASYKRWWQAREMWGGLIQGTRSLLTLVPATDANESAERRVSVLTSAAVSYSAFLKL